MKRIDVEPDLDVWRDYAVAHQVHPAIITYLESKPESFYHVRQVVDGTRLVTARGWEDLSRMLVAYEQVGLHADQELISQYIQDPDIAEDFALFLELFAKYQSDCRVNDILDGTASPEMTVTVKEAPFDERVAIMMPGMHPMRYVNAGCAMRTTQTMPVPNSKKPPSHMRPYRLSGRSA